MRFRLTIQFLSAVLMLLALPLAGQSADPASLPEAPIPVSAELAQNTSPQTAPQSQQEDHPNPLTPLMDISKQPVHFARRMAREIPPGQQAVPLSNEDKLKLAAYQQIRPTSFGTQLLSAGWGQLINSHPKYGTDTAAFGERLGAAAIRQGSQAIFSDGVLAIVFHQDTRYYRLETKPFRNRVEYAAARVFVGKTDMGYVIPNYSKLIGYAGAAMLTRTYYPDVSTGWGTVWEGYGLSLVTAMVGNELREFGPDAVHLVFHRHKAERATSSPS